MTDRQAALSDITHSITSMRLKFWLAKIRFGLYPEIGHINYLAGGQADKENAIAKTRMLE